MGGQMSRQKSVLSLCQEEWDLYIDNNRDFKSEWEMILDDARHVNVTTTTSHFLAHFSDLIENLFLGCKDMVSDELHNSFVDILVKRMEEIVRYDYKHATKDFTPPPVKLIRYTEDAPKDRKTQMIFVMIARVEKKHKWAENVDDLEANWEICLKLQLRSHKDEQVVTQRTRQCTENALTLPDNLVRLGLLDPT